MVKVMSRYGSGQHSYITSLRVAGTPGNIIHDQWRDWGEEGGEHSTKQTGPGACRERESEGKL